MTNMRIKQYPGLSPTVEINAPAERQQGDPVSTVTWLLRSLGATQDQHTVLVDAKTLLLAFGQGVDLNSVTKRDVVSYAYDTDTLTIARAVALSSTLAVTGALTVAGVTISAAIAPTITQEVTFTETSGAGVWTGTMALPAGARIIDIGCDGQALWTSQTSASLIVGDGADPDGFFLATDLKANDLLAGEINNLEHPGGLAGVYIGSEQRNLYQATARNIVAVLTKVGTSGTAGRTRVYVTYTVPTATAATKV